MSLTGYQPICGKRKGGLKSITLIAAEAVKNTEYDFVSDSYTSLIISQGSTPANYHFREDEAEYIEEVICRSGITTVSHTLSLSLTNMDCLSRRAVEELMATDSGLVAIAETMNGVRLLIGYSEKFGPGLPLRLYSAKALTGKKPLDFTGENVILKSVDSSKALALTGGIMESD